MYVRQLALQNFRNYRRLGLELEPGVALFCGQNGQGKSNLLEAIYVLATTKSPRTSSERQLVSWRQPAVAAEGALPSPEAPPFARLEARVRREHEGETHLELLFKGDEAAAEGRIAEAPGPYETGALGEVTGRLARSIKVDGLPTRAAELLGRLTVVYFAPEDVALAGGPPANRRRYLDLANSQVAPLYLRALQQYNRILLQRNHVLRQIRERRQPPQALAAWTDQLVRTGAYVLHHRLQMLVGINARANDLFHDLAGVGANQQFRVVYRMSASDQPFGGTPDEPAPETKAIAASLMEKLEHLSRREIEQAASLAGPHRDDFSLMLDDVDLNTYGSRGQQRLAVLALKLAEADWMRAETDHEPVVLLDDVLSELDPQKRGYVLSRVMPGNERSDCAQLWITSTEIESFPPELLASAQRYKIDAGTVSRA